MTTTGSTTHRRGSTRTGPNIDVDRTGSVYTCRSSILDLRDEDLLSGSRTRRLLSLTVRNTRNTTTRRVRSTADRISISRKVSKSFIVPGLNTVLRTVHDLYVTTVYECSYLGTGLSQIRSPYSVYCTSILLINSLFVLLMSYTYHYISFMCHERP